MLFTDCDLSAFEQHSRFRALRNLFWGNKLTLQVGRCPYAYVVNESEIQTERQLVRQTDRQTNERTDRWADGQTDDCQPESNGRYVHGYTLHIYKLIIKYTSRVPSVGVC